MILMHHPPSGGHKAGARALLLHMVGDLVNNIVIFLSATAYLLWGPPGPGSGMVGRWLGVYLVDPLASFVVVGILAHHSKDVLVAYANASLTGAHVSHSDAGPLLHSCKAVTPPACRSFIRSWRSA